MREIQAKTIGDVVYRLLLKSNICPSSDVLDEIKNAYEIETGTAKEALKQILLNAEIAKEDDIPYCQDTGMAVVFLEIGQDVHISGDLDGEINNGVRRAYSDGYFRCSVLDPISRKNTKDNTPAVIHTQLVCGGQIKITVAPKGFGSENMSVLKMLNPSDGIDGIIKTVTDAVKNAKGSPCPPVILGIGIGGTVEKCTLIAKQQLLREINKPNPDKQLDELEKNILEKVNALGLGAMGFAGKVYCLGVNIGKFPTHIAALPVCVNFQCHAARHECEVL